VVSPTASSSARSAGAPTDSTGAPLGRSAASSSAAAWADVTTSVAVAGTPRPSSRSATSAARRDALFVTYATGVPLATTARIAGGAPGTASVPRYTTPSRSNTTRS
jgi:hypothetical protein